MRLKDRRVFVSGGNGVIGNPLIEKLSEEGAIIYVGDIKPKPIQWKGNIRYRQGDLNFITKEELEDFQPEYFFHLAATFERSTETYEFWEENYWHNIRLSNHLMSLMKYLKSLKKIIFASSYLIYDPQLYSFKNPVDNAYRLKETDPIYPRNLTGVAKLNHEVELRFLSEFKRTQFQTISARIFRSYGKNSRDIISRWIRALLKEEELTVFKPEGLFDYIYAEEVAEGLVIMALNPTSEGIINLGNDNARKVEDVLKILKLHFPKLTYKLENSDIPYEGSQANMDHFYKIFDWRPSIQLEEAIPKMIEFEKNKLTKFYEIPKFNVLVTSISNKVSMLKCVKQACLKINLNIKLMGGDISKDSIGRFFVDQFWQMQPIKDLNIEYIVQYCLDNNIKLIIPSRDGELEFWSSIKNQLYIKGIHVLISDSATINTCLDKLKFFETMAANNLPVIPTYLQIDEIKDASKYVVKERYGAGSISIGLNLSKHDAIKHAANLQNPIFQPYIAALEISIDAFADNSSKLKGVVLRKRELVVNGESQITTTFKDEKLERLCAQIIETLKIKGHSVLQIFIDNTNKYHIIECNSRFGGASALSIKYGLDSFYWAILESLGQDLQEYPFLKLQGELTQIRYATDIYKSV